MGQKGVLGGKIGRKGAHRERGGWHAHVFVGMAHGPGPTAHAHEDVGMPPRPLMPRDCAQRRSWAGAAGALGVALRVASAGWAKSFIDWRMIAAASS